MYQTLHRLVTGALCALTLAILASCSQHGGEILNTIPASTSAVAMADIKAICSDLGITLTKEGPVYGDSIKNNIPANLDEFARLASGLQESGAADLTSVAVFMAEGGTPVATFAISNFDDFKETVGDKLTWGSDAEGMHVGWHENRISVIASDNQAWLSDYSDEAAKTVKTALDQAKKNPLGKIEGVAHHLGGQGLIRIATVSQISAGGDDNTAEAQQTLWNAASVTSEGQTLTINYSLIKGDGEKQTFKGLQTINPAVLAYVPAGMTVAAAAGVTPEFDWSVLGQLAALTGDFQTQAMLSAAMPYLTSIDGTVLLAAGPANEDAYSDLDPGNWRFILMAHLSQEKVNQLLGMVRTMCFTAGITPREDPRTGSLIIPQYGMDMHMGNIDGYFTVANFPIDDTNNNDLAPLFVNQQAAAQVNLPRLSDAMLFMPDWGVDARMQMAGTDARVTVSLPGSKGSVLGNLLQLML